MNSNEPAVVSGGERSGLAPAGGLLGTVGGWVTKLNTGLAFIAMVAIVAMMVLTTCDAGGRYLFNMPVQGAVEVTGEYLLVATVFLAMGYTYQKGMFIRVTFFVTRIPKVPRLALDYVVQLICSVITIIMVWCSWVSFQRVYETQTASNSLYHYQLWPAYAMVVLGSLLLAIVMTTDLLNVRSRMTGMIKRELETDAAE